MSHFNRVLITGAAGALGKQLRKSGQTLAKHVRLTDLIPSTDCAAHEEDRPCNLDDMQWRSMSAVEGCDSIVHLGAKATEGTWDEVLHSNIIGTYNIYEAARRHGVKRIVYASSIMPSATTSATTRSTPRCRRAPTASTASRRPSASIC